MQLFLTNFGNCPLQTMDSSYPKRWKLYNLRSFSKKTLHDVYSTSNNHLQKNWHISGTKKTGAKISMSYKSVSSQWLPCLHTPLAAVFYQFAVERAQKTASNEVKVRGPWRMELGATCYPAPRHSESNNGYVTCNFSGSDGWEYLVNFVNFTGILWLDDTHNMGTQNAFK